MHFSERRKDSHDRQGGDGLLHAPDFFLQPVQGCRGKLQPGCQDAVPQFFRKKGRGIPVQAGKADHRIGCPVQKDRAAHGRI